MVNFNPLISILVPIYGVEKYIERCFLSIINQDYDNIEIIFVNDCTLDNSVLILQNLIAQHKKYKNKIHILHHASNKGLASARKTALLAAKGEYVIHIDSDDWIEPGAIKQLASVAFNENADMVVGDYFHAYLNYKEKISYTIPKCTNIYAQELACRNPSFPVSIWNRLIRREVHLKALPIDGLNFGEDYVTVPRIVSYCIKIIKLDIPTYNYWQENTASYIKNFSYKSFNDLKLATDIICEFYSRDEHMLDKDIINTIRLKNKIILLQLGSPKFGAEAWSLWPNIQNTTNLSTLEKIIWYLAYFHLFKLIHIVLKIGAFIKSLSYRLFKD